MELFFLLWLAKGKKELLDWMVCVDGVRLGSFVWVLFCMGCFQRFSHFCFYVDLNNTRIMGEK